MESMKLDLESHPPMAYSQGVLSLWLRMVRECCHLFWLRLAKYLDLLSPCVSSMGIFSQSSMARSVLF